MMTLRTPVQTRSKLPDVGTTIFTVIGQLSAQHNAINLSQGAPNFSCDPKLVAGVTRAMEAGHNQYAAMTGLQTLKERIAEKSHRFTARNMTPVAKCWSPPAPAKDSTRR
jgi:aspartate/methionine/tyrosine aminotransferase